MKLTTVDKKQLKSMKASAFSHGDVVECGKYIINIQYKKEGAEYEKPWMLSYVTDKNFKAFDCTPGCGRPYFIDNFLHR